MRSTPVRHVCSLLWWVACLLASPAAAGPAAERGRAETGAGFVAGPVGGIGFALRRFYESGLGFQVGGLAFADDGGTTVIAGVQGMHTLKVRPSSRFYLLAGAMHIHSDTTDYVYPQYAVAPGFAPPPLARVRRDDSTTNLGAGLGISWGRSDGITVSVELPLVLHFDHDFSLDGVAPIPQVSLVYNY